MASNTVIGKQGEEIAVNYLINKGYKIRQTNWRFHHLEIDIIAQDKDFLVFVEVKTRTSGDFGYPEDAVSKQKIRRIVDAAEAYILNYDLDVDSRFDIISILIPQNKAPEIEHFDDAFLAP